jgi:hypothetical protein
MRSAIITLGALVLSLTLFFTSTKESREVKKSSRGPASVSSEDAVIPANLKQPRPTEPDSQSTVSEDREASFLNALTEVENELSTETRAWAQKLPVPQTPLEKALWIYLQVAHQDEAEVTEYLLKNSSSFLRADSKTTDYLNSSFQALEVGRDQKVRNFIYQFAKEGFPNRPFGYEISQDYQSLVENPQNFSAQDQEKLEQAMMTAPDISSEFKLSYR